MSSLRDSLPSNWGSYSAAEKIDYFNAKDITPAQLQSEGVSSADIAWMQANGYEVTNTPVPVPVSVAYEPVYEPEPVPVAMPVAYEPEPVPVAMPVAYEPEPVPVAYDPVPVAVAEQTQVEQITMELPRFVVAAIENAAAGTVDDKVAWLIDQRLVMSDEDARARAEAVLGVQDDDAWALLQQLADEAQGVEASPQVPVPVAYDPVPVVVADQTQVQQITMELPRFVVAAIENAAAGTVDDKVAWLIDQRLVMSDEDARARVEAVLGVQDDDAWALLQQLADEAQGVEERATGLKLPEGYRIDPVTGEIVPVDATVILKPPASPSTPKAPILPMPINKPFFVPGTTPTVKSETTEDQTMQRTIGNQILPAGWDQYSAIQKITWFNRNNITPSQLKAEGVSDTDIAWMRSNGYIVGAQASGLNPVLIAAAAAAYFLIGS